MCVEPQFFRETTPLPYKSTRWIRTSDFTGGQARRFRYIIMIKIYIANKTTDDLPHHLQNSLANRSNVEARVESSHPIQKNSIPMLSNHLLVLLFQIQFINTLHFYIYFHINFGTSHLTDLSIYVCTKITNVQLNTPK